MANFDFDTTVGAVTSTSTLSNLISKADFESLLRNLKPTDNFKVPSGSGISVPDTYYDFTSSGPGSGTWEVYYDVAGSSGYEGWSSPANAFADTGEITASQTSSAVAVGAVFTNLFAGDSTNGWNVTTGTEHFILKSGSVELVVKVDTANSKITNVYSNTGGTATDVTGDAPVPIMNTDGSDPDPSDDSVSGGITINPDGGSVFDFRVNGDTDNPLFFCDVDSNLTSIGGLPETGYKLKVTGNTKLTGNLDIGGTVDSGTWNGSVIGTAYGGTGLSTIGTANQILQSDGSSLSWVDNTPTLISLTDTTLSGLANGDILKYDGTAWVNATGYATESYVDTELDSFVTGLTSLSSLATDDELAIYDTSATTNKKVTMANLAISLAGGNGINSIDGSLYLDLSELTSAAIAPASDSIVFVDEGATGDPTKKESVADFVTAIAGTGLDVNASTKKLELDIPALQSLTHLQINTDDEFAVYDASETGVSHKSLTLGSLASKLAGTGLSASNGVLSAAGSLDGLSDVNIGTLGASNHYEVLYYNNNASNWDSKPLGDFLGLSDSTTYDATNLDVANDNVLWIDSSDSHKVKRSAIHQLVSEIAGEGLTSTNGVMEIDIAGLSGMSSGNIASNDELIIYDTGSTINRGVTFENLVSKMAGTDLSASSGVLSVDDLNASKITAGTLSTSRIPNLDASKITTGIYKTYAGGNTGYSPFADIASGNTNAGDLAVKLNPSGGLEDKGLGLQVAVTAAATTKVLRVNNTGTSYTSSASGGSHPPGTGSEASTNKFASLHDAFKWWHENVPPGGMNGIILIESDITEPTAGTANGPNNTQTIYSMTAGYTGRFQIIDSDYYAWANTTPGAGNRTAISNPRKKITITAGSGVNSPMWFANASTEISGVRFEYILPSNGLSQNFFIRCQGGFLQFDACEIKLSSSLGSSHVYDFYNVIDAVEGGQVRIFNSLHMDYSTGYKYTDPWGEGTASAALQFDFSGLRTSTSSSNNGGVNAVISATSSSLVLQEYHAIHYPNTTAYPCRIHFKGSKAQFYALFVLIGASGIKTNVPITRASGCAVGAPHYSSAFSPSGISDQHGIVAYSFNAVEIEKSYNSSNVSTWQTFPATAFADAIEGVVDVDYRMGNVGNAATAFDTNGATGPDAGTLVTGANYDA